MSKTILSFDVGIVNLAYCIIKKIDNNFEIIKWDIINIDDNKLICSHKNITKNKTTECKKNAKYIYNEEYICSSHYNTFMKKFNKNKIDTEKCDKLIKCDINRCKINAEVIYKNNNYCIKHYNKLYKEYLTENTPKKIKSQNSNYKSIENLSKHLFKKLDEIKIDILNVDEVLIENQPSLINPTMKTISALIYSYFTIRGIIDKKETNSNIQNVYFISPQNKLKINKETTDKALNNENLNKREEYILTKDLGKKYCHGLVKHNEKYLNILEHYKNKSDDLCDSFLQGFYYLFYKDGNFPIEFRNTLDIVSDEYNRYVIEKEKKQINKKQNKLNFSE